MLHARTLALIRASVGTKDNRKWHASTGYQNRLIHIGYFDYEENAAIAYDDMAIELLGEFACLNFHYHPEIREWGQQMYLFRSILADSGSFGEEPLQKKETITQNNRNANHHPEE